MSSSFIEKQLLSGGKSKSENTEFSYSQLMDEVQQYIVREKMPELTDALVSDDFELLKTIVADYIGKNHRIFNQETTNKIIADMTGFGFLNAYFAKKDEIEEININAWNSVEVRYCDGRDEMIDDCFNSPEQAKDILLRILRLQNKHIDNNNLYAVSYIGKEIRIAAAVHPLVDKETAIAASIRFTHSAVYDIDRLVKSGMMNQKMADLLNLLINHGASICFCGGTGSGKTTVANALLMNVPAQTRIITLEDGTREFDLIKENEKNKICNNRVHLITRPSKNADMNVDLQTLLDLILKFDPDIVAVGEMVSEEAFIAAETARTGHTVISTIHTKNAFEAYHRMFTLGRRKYSFDEDMMLHIMCEAFPIIVYTKKYPDGVRRIQTILEGKFVDGDIKFNELWRFFVASNEEINGQIRVSGEFKQINKISAELKQIMRDNGVENAVIEQF